MGLGRLYETHSGGGGYIQHHSGQYVTVMGLGRLYETHSGGGGGYNHTILVNQLL